TAMHAWINTARALGTTVLDRAELAYLEMKGLGAAEQLAEAIVVGRTALADLGVRFPAKPTRRHLLPEPVSVRRKLRGRSDEQLPQLPQTTDAETLAAQKLLGELYGPAYTVEPDLWPLLALRCVRLTLEVGRVPASPVAFAGYGLLLSIMGRYQEARRYGDLALAMAEEPESRDHRPWTKFLYYDFIHHWT